jgi:hypothetical protein
MGYRCLRPANRIDPMRTIMELEVVSVCWDALDGSTLFQVCKFSVPCFSADISVCGQILDSTTLTSLSLSMNTAIRLLMVTWYVSVGIRIGTALFDRFILCESRCCEGVMYVTHLPPTTRLYQYILPPPLALSLEPTVDRTLQAMRLRSMIIVVMTGWQGYSQPTVSNVC